MHKIIANYPILIVLGIGKDNFTGSFMVETFYKDKEKQECYIGETLFQNRTSWC